MIEKSSPLLEEEKKIIEEPNYSDEESTYLRNLKSRMGIARDARDTNHDEFDGMDYLTYHQQNERLANTYIEPKKNKEDSNFQSGTIRTKLMALLASVVNLDLAGDISALDKNGLKIQAMGDAMEDIILKTNQLDSDDEKKMLRQYELLSQGTVFVEEVWDEKKKKEKKMKGKWNGKIIKNWETKIKDAFARPTRNIVPGVNVYLGDITKYNISEQPYIFTVEQIPWAEAEVKFGQWERWESVPRTLIESTETSASVNWRLLEQDQERVEIIRYQDKWNNEFAILINGVLMTPVGLPLPWGYEDYNIAQQNLEPIHSKFAYGKSLVFKIRNKVALLDEMQKLSALKTQMSFKPPRYNISGRVVSSSVFMPGKIIHGVPPGSLPPVEGENTGVTTAEFSFMDYIENSINSETTSPVFQGASPGGNPTATEIVEIQRQAKQMLGLTIFAVSMLEWKLEWLRLQNLIAHWFNQRDTVVDEMRNEVKNKYQTVSVDRNIEGEGMGTRMTIPSDTIPSSEAIMQAEDIYKQETGVPVRMIFVKPEEVTSSKLCWQIVITPREKRTSETQKLMFRAEMADAQAFGPLLNIQYLGEKFASVWGENPQKLFKTPEQLQAEQEQAQMRETEGAGKVVAPPTPEGSAGGKQLQNSLAM